jgi:hypothetical protein
MLLSFQLALEDNLRAVVWRGRHRWHKSANAVDGLYVCCLQDGKAGCPVIRGLETKSEAGSYIGDSLVADVGPLEGHVSLEAEGVSKGLSEGCPAPIW